MKTDLVIGGLLIHDGKVLLIHHKGLDIWIPLGGHIDEDETPDDAVIREFKEEMNLDVKLLNKNEIPAKGNIVKHLAVPFYVNVHRISGVKGMEEHDHCCLFYLCTISDPRSIEKIKVDESELKDHAWFSPEELNQERIPADTRNIALKAFELYKRIKAGEH
jgi:8-oxo-dGTP diphosphatase